MALYLISVFISFHFLRNGGLTMKKSKVLLVLLTLLLYQFSYVIAAPYWVKPGVEITYIAKRDNAYIQQQLESGKVSSPDNIKTASLVYLRNGTYYSINAHNTSTLSFRIASIKDGYAIVDVVLDLKNVTVSFEVPNGSKVSTFWDNGSVLNYTCRKPLGGTNLVCTYRLRGLSFQGRYKIRLDDDAVFSMNGTYYGRTVLWIDPLHMPANGTVLYRHGNTTLKVKNIFSTQKKMKTYAGTFGPPLVWIYTSEIDVKYGPVEAQGMNVYVYDGLDYYVLLSWFGLAGIPDFEAAGIPIVSLFDEAAGREGIKTMGPMLYRFTPLQSGKNTTMSTQQGTNTQTPESSGATGVEFSGNGGTTKYVFYGLLALLGLVIALSIWRRGKK